MVRGWSRKVWADTLAVGDESLIVVVLGTRRKFAFPVLEEAVERVKKEIPIWKKEVTYEKAYLVENMNRSMIRLVMVNTWGL